MVRLYLIRHAESIGNVEEFFQGSLDVKISSKGFRQLEELKSRFQNINLDRIYSSPLERALKTARYVNFYQHLDIIRVPEIAEINAGDFQGKKWSDLPVLFPEEYYNWKENPENFQSPNGESMKDVSERMAKAMNEIISENNSKNNSNINIAVISHGCAIKTYQSYLIRHSGNLKLNMSELDWADNTSVSEIIFDENLNPDIVYLNDSSHLSAENSTLKFSEWCKK